MKIAVVDHVGNHGGGSRVVKALLPALLRVDPTLQLTYFGSPASIRRESLAADFGAIGIQVVGLQSLRMADVAFNISSKMRRIVDLIQTNWLSRKKWLPPIFSGNVKKEIEKIASDYDLVFYPWPFLLDFPEIKIPSVGIFHDFNFKYYFGGSFTFSPSQREQLEREMPRWLANAIPVVSTHFMASELHAFYPEAAHKVNVVHLAPLGGTDPVEGKIAQDIVKQYGIKTPYVLYPTHMCTHKNIGPLIAAISLLRESGRQVTLVLTGAGTDAVKGKSHAVGVRLDQHPGDVLGLGYVSNLQINALTQCAAVVVSPSLYEAGNGPGLDAWGRGVPVAMSDIPAFAEHLDVFGVRAQVFDPRNPRDIADKIANILDNPSQAMKDAEISKNSLRKLTWESTAEEYLRVFKIAMESGSSLP